MKIGILTMFSGLSNTYSLVNVVAEHITMLLNHDYGVKLIVTEDLNENEKWGIYKDPRIEWFKVKNTLNDKPITLHDYSSLDKKLHNSFYDEAKMFCDEFIIALHDVDTCIMHDILYQGWHYVHNIAIRKAQNSLSQVKFISFTHSFPFNRPVNPPKELEGRFIGMKNTIFAYPSLSGLPSLAKQYKIPEGNCRVIYNTIPLIEELSEEVQELHKKVDLLSPDILIIYPGRFSTGKKFEKVVSLAGAIKQISEKKVKIIFCNFPCLDTPEEEYKKAIRGVGEVYDLTNDDIIFTSEEGFPNGFPRKSVFDLFILSNLYICPSFSETFGLTVAEAASRGNFIVVNECVPALEELGKMLGAYFMKWDARNYGYDTKQSYNPSEVAYNLEHGMRIVQLMRENNAINAKTIARTKLNSEWVWKNQLEPLLQQ